MQILRVCSPSTIISPPDITMHLKPFYKKTKTPPALTSAPPLCISMDLNIWCNSLISNIQNVAKIGSRSMVSLNELAISADDQNKINIMPINIRKWRVLWRRIKKEKKRTLQLFDCSTSTQVVHVPYDPHTYSKNFDQGSAAWADPDVLSRSFSARFAVPCRVFHQTAQSVS